MVVVGAEWEFGWNTPIKEYDLWHFPMREFGVDEIAFSPVSGINKKGIREFRSIEEMIDFYNIPVVLGHENGNTNLVDFKHPEDALYLFGRTSRDLFPAYGHIYPSLRVETPVTKGMIWGHQAASIIMYDRFLKNGNNNSR